MSENIKTVVAFTADKSNVTLYCEDGTTHILQSNREFTQQVIDQITPALSRKETITLDLTDHTLNIFVKVEKQSKGLVRFFRVAKAALLGGDAITTERLMKISLPIGNYELNNPEETIVAVVKPEPELNMREAAEITQDDLEAAADYHDHVLVQKPAESVVVGAEHLTTQLSHFSGRDQKGLNNFLQRIAKVSAERSHTAQELLEFMSKADLPIADDGAIIAYKRVVKRDNHFVDTHTKKIVQSVGSRVFMKAEMVDPDRTRDCSNGLHIGRRDYMGSFSGNAIVIIKVYPEDVIAVPVTYGFSKMRCSSYTIVAEVSQAGFNLLVNGKAMTDDPAMAMLLTQIIAGDHAPVSETVEIKGSYGTNIERISLDQKKSTILPPEPEKKEVAPTKAIEPVVDLRATVDPVVNSPKAIKQKLEEVAPPVEMTPNQKKAKELWPKVLDKSMSKMELARQCNTSSRSLDRWAEKFNF